MRFLYLLSFWLCSVTISAQLIIGDSTSIHPNLSLVIQSKEKGFLPTRTQLIHQKPFGLEGAGMLMYNIQLNQLLVHDGESWNGLATDTNVTLNKVRTFVNNQGVLLSSKLGTPHPSAIFELKDSALGFLLPILGSNHQGIKFPEGTIGFDSLTRSLVLFHQGAKYCLNTYHNSPPEVINVQLSLLDSSHVKVEYSYFDKEQDDSTGAIYQWFVVSDTLIPQPILIETTTSPRLSLTEYLAGKFLYVKVYPIAVNAPAMNNNVYQSKLFGPINNNPPQIVYHYFKGCVRIGDTLRLNCQYFDHERDPLETFEFIWQRTKDTTLALIDFSQNAPYYKLNQVDTNSYLRVQFRAKAMSGNLWGDWQTTNWLKVTGPPERVSIGNAIILNSSTLKFPIYVGDDLGLILDSIALTINGIKSYYKFQDTLTLTGLSPGISYQAIVSVKNQNGYSKPSDAKELKILAPSNVTPPFSTRADVFTLRCNGGAWINQVSVEFQWFKNGLLINGAVYDSLKLNSNDMGATFYCRVKANNVIGSTLVNSNNLMVSPLTAQESVCAAFALRKIMDGYNGPLVMVSNGINLQNIGADTLGNLDTLALKSFAGNGSAFVQVWYNQADTSKNAVITNANSRPRIVVNGIVQRLNGRPTLNFDANNMPLEVANVPELSDDHFVSLVHKRDVNSTTTTLVQTINANTKAENSWSIANGSFLLYTYNLGLGSSTLVRNVSANNQSFMPYVISRYYEVNNPNTSFTGLIGPGNLCFRINGAQVGNLISTNQWMDALNARSLRIGNGNTVGRLGELILFKNAANTAMRQWVEQSQSVYFGIAF